MTKQYIDIGHGNPKALLWLYDGRVHAAPVGASNTHESVWGMAAMDYWRGRYDPATHEISIVPPNAYRGTHIPDALMEKLEARFSGDIIPIDFNPRKG